MFHSRIKTINHIEEKLLRCRLVILSCYDKLLVETVMRLDEEDAQKARVLARVGRRRHHAEVMAERLQGTLIREAVVVGISHRSLLRTPGVMADDDMVSQLGEARAFAA